MADFNLDLEDEAEELRSIEAVNPIEETITTFLLADRNTKWLLACKKIIMLLGSHPSIQDKEKGINNLLPKRPDRDVIRKDFVKSLTGGIKILQSGSMQRAEDEGIISSLCNQSYEDILCLKASMIISALSENGIINIEKIISRSAGIPLQGGGFRKGYQQSG